MSLIVGSGLILGSLVIPAVAAADSSVTNYAIPASPAAEGDAHQVFSGTDGTVWLVDTAGHVGLVSDNGQVTEYAVPGLPSPMYGDLFSATVDGLGNLWLVAGANIVRVTPAGQQWSYTPTAGAATEIVAVASDGVWFAGPSIVGRITAAKNATEFSVSTSTPRRLTVAADGAVWYVGNSPSRVVGRVAPGGTALEVAVSGTPRLVPVGASSMWVSTDSYDSVGDVRGADGVVTSSGVGVPDAGLITDKQGNRWFRVPSSPLLAHKTPLGDTSSFSTDYAYKQLLAAKDEGIWSTDGLKAAKIIADGSAPNKARLTEYTLAVADPGSVGTGAVAVPAATGGFWSVRRDGVLMRMRDNGTATSFSVPVDRRVATVPDDQGGLWFRGPSSSIGRVSAGGAFQQWLTPRRPASLVSLPGSGVWYLGSTTNTPVRPRLGHVTPTGVVTEYDVDAVYDGSAPFQWGELVVGPDSRVWWYAGRQVFATGASGTSTVMYSAPAGEQIGDIAVSGSRVWVSTRVGSAPYYQGRYVSLASGGGYAESALVGAPGSMYPQHSGGIWVIRGFVEGDPGRIYSYKADASPDANVDMDVERVIGLAPAGGLVVTGDTGTGQHTYLVRSCGVAQWPDIDNVVQASDGRVWTVETGSLAQLTPEGLKETIPVAGLSGSVAQASSDNALWINSPGRLGRIGTTGVGSVTATDWSSCGSGNPDPDPNPNPDPNPVTPAPGQPGPVNPGPALTESPTATAPTAPAAVGKARGKLRGTRLAVSWPAVSGATSYKVRVSKPGGKKYLAWKTVTKPAFKGKVKKNRKYRLQIIAVGPGGQSPVRTVTIS